MLDAALIENYNKTRPFPADTFCYAPFSSLYFGHEGKVTACCENREHVLGVYPHQSIRDIWNGKSAHQLRKYISEQNLWHGCKGCDFDLRSGNFGGIHARIFDNARLRQKDTAYPSMLEFELENTCNLECVMCTGIFSSSIRKNREHLPPIPSPYDEHFVAQLAEFIPHVSLANFFGGEPFLVELYYSIWEKMAALNPSMQVWVTTNCTILNKRVKDLLGRLKFNLTCSIDSLEKNVYESIRVNGNFERVMENLEWFLQYTQSNQTDFTLNTCPMPQNWKGLPDIIRWGNEKGVVVNIIPVRNPEDMSLRSQPAGMLKEISAYYRAFDFPADNFFSARNKKNFEDYARFVEQWFHYKEQMEHNLPSPHEAKPLETIKHRIATHIHFSSGSPESKQQRTDAAVNKIVRIHKKLQDVDSELGDAVWAMALQASMDELLFALFAWDEDSILAQARGGIAHITDQMNDTDEEQTHYKRLRIFTGYMQLTGTSPAAIHAALNRWKLYLDNLRHKNPAAKADLLRMINEHAIAHFSQRLLRGEEQTLLQEWQTSASI